MKVYQVLAAIFSGCIVGTVLCYAMWASADNGALRRECWHKTDDLNQMTYKLKWTEEELRKTESRLTVSLQKYLDLSTGTKQIDGSGKEGE